MGAPHRSRLRAVQTPQGFASATLVAAHRLGADRAADESGVVVEGDPLAMKVTTPLDLALAEVLAPAR